MFCGRVHCGLIFPFRFNCAYDRSGKVFENMVDDAMATVSYIVFGLITPLRLVRTATFDIF